MQRKSLAIKRNKGKLCYVPPDSSQKPNNMASRIIKAITNFVGETDSSLLTQTDLIITGMTANPNFPVIVPTLPELQTSRDNYNDSLLTAGTGNHAAIADKNAKRLALENDLSTLGNYINTKARGNAVVLSTTMFPLTKEPETGVLGAVEFMKLTPGTKSGTLECKLKRVKNSKSYTFKITSDPITKDSAWESFVTTSCKFTFTGLIPGNLYWVKVLVAGTRGQTVESGPIQQYALL